ncbi:hypothetical protein RHS03_07864, partial [Rhizoctonia solani]
MEPEPSLRVPLDAINILTTQVGSLQDQVKSQGKQITQLLTLCRESNNFVSNKDQAKPGNPAGPSTPPTQTGAQANTPGSIRPGLANCYTLLTDTTGLTLFF